MYNDFMEKTLRLVVMRLLFRKFRIIFLNNQTVFKWYSSNYMTLNEFQNPHSY